MAFYIQLFNKAVSVCSKDKQNLSISKPKVPQDSQTYYLKKLTDIDACLLHEIELSGRLVRNMK